jgi:hypothetical protein
MDEKFVRHGGVAAVNISLFALVFVVITCRPAFILPRRHVLFPFFVRWFFIPLGQRVSSQA